MAKEIKPPSQYSKKRISNPFLFSVPTPFAFQPGSNLIEKSPIARKGKKENKRKNLNAKCWILALTVRRNEFCSAFYSFPLDWAVVAWKKENLMFPIKSGVKAAWFVVEHIHIFSWEKKTDFQFHASLGRIEFVLLTSGSIFDKYRARKCRILLLPYLSMEYNTITLVTQQLLSNSHLKISQATQHSFRLLLHFCGHKIEREKNLFWDNFFSERKHE